MGCCCSCARLPLVRGLFRGGGVGQRHDERPITSKECQHMGFNVPVGLAVAEDADLLGALAPGLVGLDRRGSDGGLLDDPVVLPVGTEAWKDMDGWVELTEPVSAHMLL